MGEKKRRLEIDVNRPLRIAICMPSQSMIYADTAMALSGLCAYTAFHAALAIMNEKASMVTNGRNKLVARALEFGADWVMFIDSDMVFPMDAIMKLVAHDKDIVGATYNKRVEPYDTLGRFVGPQRKLEGGLIEAELLPAGFLLIRAEVFRSMIEPDRSYQVWFREHYDQPEPQRLISEDYSFCMKARRKGWRIWCDLDLTAKLGHIGERLVTCQLEMPAADEAKAA